MNQLYEGYYVCPCGRIYSYKQNKFIKMQTNNHGYLIVKLRVDNKTITKLVHRIVANTYIDNPLNKPQIDHIDGNKFNNNISNLRWVTQLENRHNPNTEHKFFGHFSSKSNYIYKKKDGYLDKTYAKRRVLKYGNEL